MSEKEKYTKVSECVGVGLGGTGQGGYDQNIVYEILRELIKMINTNVKKNNGSRMWWCTF